MAWLYRDFGDPYLREVIASTYHEQASENILCFAGASEGIYAANHVILDKDSHAIVVTPNYQSHEALPASIASVERCSFARGRRLGT